MIQQFHFWVYTQKNWKQGLKEIFIHLYKAAFTHIDSSIFHNS